MHLAPHPHALIFALLAAAVAALDAEKASADPSPCQFQSQPGLGYLGMGVDLTSFIPRVGAISELKSNVVERTCDKLSNKWTNPYSNSTFRIWDQISSIMVDSSSVTAGAFFTLSDTFAFDDHFSASVTSGLLFGMFSASAELDQVFNLAVKADVSLYYEYGKVNALVAALDSGELHPSQEYLKAVDEFPLLWWQPTNWPAVAEHIKTYGTHYIWKVSLGGEFRYESMCDSIYVGASGSIHAQAQAQLDFLYLLSCDMNGVNGADVCVGASGAAAASEYGYQAACIRQVTCIGGEQTSCNKNSSSSWEDFVASVDSSTPGLTDAQYLFAPDLVKFVRPIKHVVLRDATIAYLAWSGLEKLFAMYVATRAELTKIAGLEDPKCFVTGVNWDPCTDGSPCAVKGFSCGPEQWKPTPGTWAASAVETFDIDGCSDIQGGIQTVTAVRNARQWATKLLNDTALHHDAMQRALASQTNSRGVDSWMAQTEAWLGSFKMMTEKVFSMPEQYSCRGSLWGDYSCAWPHYCWANAGISQCTFKLGPPCGENPGESPWVLPKGLTVPFNTVEEEKDENAIFV